MPRTGGLAMCPASRQVGAVWHSFPERR